MDETDNSSELFHYTSIDALESIYKSRQFWATYYKDMNDESEQTRFRLIATKHVLPLVESKFRQRMERDSQFALRVNQGGGLDVAAKHDAQVHVRTMHNSIFAKLSGPFIVSFCRHPESTYEAENGLLSMWRGYGSAGGVAIVLSVADVKTLLRHESDSFGHFVRHLGNVRHDNDDDGIKSDFRGYFDAVPSILDDFYNDTPPRYEDVFNPFVEGTILVKHRAFHEEHEARIVVCPRCTDPNSVFYNSNYAGLPTKSTKYRNRSGSEARYIELFGSQPLPIRRVIVGPSRTQRANKQRVEEILSTTQVSVEMSGIPFAG